MVARPGNVVGVIEVLHSPPPYGVEVKRSSELPASLHECCDILADHGVPFAPDRLVPGDQLPEGGIVARYGDVALNKMVETTLKVNPADDIASMLQKKHFDYWTDLGLGFDDVFRLLKLDDGLDGLLTNPNLSVWVKFVSSSGGNTGSKTPLINALRSHYDDAALLKKFVAAKKNPETANVATSLGHALVGQLRLNRVKNGH